MGWKELETDGFICVIETKMSRMSRNHRLCGRAFLGSLKMHLRGDKKSLMLTSCKTTAAIAEFLCSFVDQAAESTVQNGDNV
jgi:hypothetical protein